MPSRDWLDYAGFAVQVLLFIGLVWYTIETRFLRLASVEQIETLQKPCVTFSMTLRDAGDAVLDMDGAVGTTIILCPEGQVQLVNTGYGPAMNIRYQFTPLNPESTRARPKGYAMGLRQGGHFQPPVPRNIMQGNDWNCVIEYESMAGRKYRTVMVARDLVLTSFSFESLK
jgi:hypothetical protein